MCTSAAQPRELGHQAQGTQACHLPGEEPALPSSGWFHCSIVLDFSVKREWRKGAAGFQSSMNPFLTPGRGQSRFSGLCSPCLQRQCPIPAKSSLFRVLFLGLRLMFISRKTLESQRRWVVYVVMPPVLHQQACCASSQPGMWSVLPVLVTLLFLGAGSFCRGCRNPSEMRGPPRASGSHTWWPLLKHLGSFLDWPSCPDPGLGHLNKDIPASRAGFLFFGFFFAFLGFSA